MLSQPTNRPSPKYMMSVNSAFRALRVRTKRDETWRIASRSFDFSCLGEKKKLLAAENFVTLVQTLRERAPAATFDDSYPQLRKLLTAVWPMVQQTSGGGWRRMRPGKFNVQAVTTTNNEAQFTRYSRLRHYLQLQGLQ